MLICHPILYGAYIVLNIQYDALSLLLLLLFLSFATISILSREWFHNICVFHMWKHVQLWLIKSYCVIRCVFGPWHQITAVPNQTNNKFTSGKFQSMKITQFTFFFLGFKHSDFFLLNEQRKEEEEKKTRFKGWRTTWNTRMSVYLIKITFSCFIDINRPDFQSMFSTIICPFYPFFITHIHKTAEISMYTHNCLASSFSLYTFFRLPNNIVQFLFHPFVVFLGWF